MWNIRGASQKSQLDHKAWQVKTCIDQLKAMGKTEHEPITVVSMGLSGLLSFPVAKWGLTCPHLADVVVDIVAIKGVQRHEDDRVSMENHYGGSVCATLLGAEACGSHRKNTSGNIWSSNVKPKNKNKSKTIMLRNSWATSLTQHRFWSVRPSSHKIRTLSIQGAKGQRHHHHGCSWVCCVDIASN